MHITDLLTEAVARQASDLHLAAGLPPLLRLHGDLIECGHPALDAQGVMALLGSIMTAQQLHTLAHQCELDFAYEQPGLTRFRVNAFQQRRGPAAAIRVVPAQVPTLDSLQAPAVLRELALLQRGLVLFTGPTGSGKSTSMAALVDHRNRHAHDHILTIEDPIEFVHASHCSLVSQREVGTHTLGFAQALRSALREDPDVILVGELRDLDTIRLALSAAETGHLVLATLHANSAAQSIDRLVDVFPAGEKDMVRVMLSESLQGVLAQTLCKTADGCGRVAALEIMRGTPAIRHLIREHKVAQMVSVMQSGMDQGMQTLDQHLSQLVRSGRISADQARLHARFPETIR
jgi:twitching motility protein PilT